MEAASRKRPFDGDTPIVVKKRAVSSANDSPVAIPSPSQVADEPRDENELELFRKEAVYRRMRWYSRELDRSQAVVEELQARSLTCQAALAAIEACWDQLLHQIHLLVKPGTLPTSNLPSDVFELAVAAEAEDTVTTTYAEALKAKELKSRELLTAFIMIAPQASPPTAAELQGACQRLQSEKSAVTGELLATKAALERTQQAASEYKDKLSAAENRYERLRSSTVQKLEARASNKQDEPTLNGSSTPKTGPKEETPVPTAPMNGMVDESWQMRAEERQHTIQSLHAELEQHKRDLVNLRLELLSPVEGNLNRFEGYRKLKATIDVHTKMEKVAAQEIAILRDEMARLTREREDFQAKVVAESNVKIQEMKMMVDKRDHDLNRLRDARDALTSELHERKAKDAEKVNAASQSKILANARAERIAMLVSENHRLKARLAAREGEEQFFAFILNKPQDESYVRELQERLALLERQKSGLESALTKLQPDHPDIARALQSEAEAREKCAEAQEQLCKYEATYGSAALTSAEPDLQALTEQLRAKDEQLRKTRLELKALQEEPSALYTEIERLSALWENLDKQVKDKVFDLAVMEERIQKAATEKAKADNKYFATMRQKDAADAERKNLQRNLDKQVKVIEKLAETEKSLGKQINQMEKESEIGQRRINEREVMLLNMQQKTEEYRSGFEGERKKVVELQTMLSERDSLITQWRQEEAKTRDEMARLKLDHDRQLIKARSSNATGSDVELAKQLDKSMTLLKCSTCTVQLRSHILTKCMHTFCKECIDARINTRQRKCPACNLAFGVGDVHQLFFQ